MRPPRLRPAGAVATSLLIAACATTALPSAPGSPAPSPFLSSAPTASPARPTPGPAATPVLAYADALAALVTLPALREHLEALQEIADAHGGHRATGSDGFDTSVEYVASVLEAGGYVVERQHLEAEGVPSVNLLTELAGEEDEVIMLGAHLDSVRAGPGINDNGSGVAALLAIADGLRGLPAQQRTVRFAFWGAEEGGPFGSAAYVVGLDPAERARIGAYLNFDLLGSPNAVRFVYDEAEAASGSGALTDLFVARLEGAGLAWEPVDLEGDSDHGPFAEAGIPTGGLFSGGFELVTDAQAAAHGARAGEPADACSHHACDTIDNVDLVTLQELAQVAARVLVALAAP